MDVRFRNQSPWSSRMVGVFDVILRVPPLFLIDCVLNLNVLMVLPLGYEELPDYGLELLVIFLLLLAGLLVALIIFCLSSHQIINVYTFLLSGCVLWASYLNNRRFVESEIALTHYPEDFLTIVTSNPSAFTKNLTIQLIFAFTYNVYRQKNMTFSYLHQFKHWKAVSYFIVLQPVIWRLIAVPPHVLAFIPETAILVLIFELTMHLLTRVKHIYYLFRSAYYTSKYTMHNFGIQSFLDSQWTRLHISDVLRWFWLSRTCICISYLTVQKFYANIESGGPGMNVHDFMEILMLQLVYGCDTMVSLMGMTSIISYITHYFGVGLAKFLRSNNEEDLNMGTMSAILFFILALQTGLTGLATDYRLSRLLKNLCLLCTAILHYVHSMVNPQLLNLSASHRMKFSLHWRPLALCAALLLAPSIFLVYLWSRFSISTWLLAVTAFSVEVILKVIISLLVYSLFIIDAYRETFWEQLDDYVYYIQSIGNTIEFLFGIFLFCNGGWIMLFESGGTIRAIMMCIHAYFNIWMQARDGWKAFMLRRTAVQKIVSLPEATPAQLVAHNDVCAICYQELQTARITACHHLFHGVCLRKWLYVRDQCPLCHQLIYPKPNNEETEDDANQNNMEQEHLHED